MLCCLIWEERLVITLLKIASDSTFNLLFWKKLLAYSMLASAKFDPCVHQSCSVEGNDLNHLVEGNQAGLICSVVFERITRPYPLPHYTQTFSTYQILRLKPLWLKTRRFFHVFPRWASTKHVTPGWAFFVP